MTETDERVLDGINQTLRLDGLVVLVERFHSHTQPGVPRETIDRYADPFSTSVGGGPDVDAFHEEVESRLTDSRTWSGGDSLYRLDPGRISRYPAEWHDRLGGTTDVRKYVDFIQEEVPEFKDDVGQGGSGPGVPEQPLLDAIAVVGRTDRDEVKAELADLRDRGEIAEDADQHPNPGVVLRDEREDLRDSTVDR
ncbi:hypothetical protein [Halomicrococcus gelatinilyticus]|uniref:hypothetical protein n=1 Tax=Halomicrococcus gelatinilyticus TaxID=1702103 RepID=UPI002E103F5D